MTAALVATARWVGASVGSAHDCLVVATKTKGDSLMRHRIHHMFKCRILSASRPTRLLSPWLRPPFLLVHEGREHRYMQVLPA